jgi:4a-hydroxytetrahydrobiopterin dehydratase
MQKLDDLEIKQNLEQLNSSLDVFWSIEEGKLTKTFRFKDFNQAFGFMTRCALYAEKVNHHPEWFNVYRTVKVQLTTHEVSGISDKDFDMAKKMDEMSKNT